MKRLGNMIKDGVLIALMSYQIAGAPVGEKRYLPKIEAISTYHNPKETLPARLSYHAIDSLVTSALKEVRLPSYLPKSSQITRAYVESGGNPSDTSSRGARGLWQLMKDAWDGSMPGYDFNKAYDPLLNAKASIRHIQDVNYFLRKNHPGWDTLQAGQKYDILNAAYNGGHGRLQDVGWDISRMPTETQKYVRKMREQI